MTFLSLGAEEELRCLNVALPGDRLTTVSHFNNSCWFRSHTLKACYRDMAYDIVSLLICLWMKESTITTNMIHKQTDKKKTN